MYRIVQKQNRLSFKGLAVGWDVQDRPDVNDALKTALPDWVIVASESAPFAVTWTDVLLVRKLARTPVNAPLILFGWGQDLHPLGRCCPGRRPRKWRAGCSGLCSVRGTRQSRRDPVPGGQHRVRATG
jgi:hypothetical protein